jgi:hypothetical protein
VKTTDAAPPPAAPAPAAVRLLTLAAEDLRNHSPSGVFADADRLILARHLTTGTELAPTALLPHMPRLDHQTTRGEYSLILADTAKGL